MNNLTALADNLNYLLKRANINAAKLARDLTLPAATIKNLRCGDNKNPTLSTLVPIAHYFSVTVSQLIGESPIADNRNNDTTATATIAQVPLLSWENVSLWPTTEREQLLNILVEKEGCPIHFALVVEEDLHNFQEGSLLLINADIQPIHKDFVIVKKHAQKTVLRQFFDEGDGVYLKPLIKESPFIPLSNEHTLLGVVCNVQKKLK